MDIIISNIKWIAVGYIIMFQTFFILKNIITRKKTGMAVNAGNRDVKIIVICFTLVFSVSVISLFSPVFYSVTIPIEFLHCNCTMITGIIFLVAALILALVSSIQLGTSWRVGVLDSQRVELVDTGIYRFCRNPYFMAYFIQIAGFFLIIPSILLLLLVIFSMINIHRMVLQEETYLLDLHGPTYAAYCNRTGRYVPKLGGITQPRI